MSGGNRTGGGEARGVGREAGEVEAESDELPLLAGRVSSGLPRDDLV